MNGDPYAVLGLPPGAALADVKRAYRRLAKAFHPDSAGEAALPRFLAVHEAYESIVSGRAARTTRGPGSRMGTSETTGGRGWAADPSRARAARDAWRGSRRAGRTSATGAAGGPAAGSGTAGAGTARGPSGAAPGRDGAPNARRAGGGNDGEAGPRAGDRASNRRRSARKATLGSTSYDDAVHEPFEPEWRGASWYGRASGTYWTVNPREYADPRKHGPEYQERARRAANLASDAVDGQRSSPADGGGRGGAATSRPETRTAGAWTTSARRTPEPAGREATDDAAAVAAAAEPAEPAEVPSLERRLERGIRWLGSARDPRARLLLAVFGWPPLGVLADRLIGEATGCASFSAACQPPADLLPLAIGAALLALLVAVPRLARVSAAGTLAIALTSVPVAALVVDPGAPADPILRAGTALTILGLAWLVGVIGVLALSRGRILRS
jgi:hypothetical protein